MSVNYFIPVRNPMIVSATNVCNLKLLDSSTHTIVKPDMHILGSSSWYACTTILLPVLHKQGLT